MEETDRTRLWFVIALCLLILVGGYLFAEWLIGGGAPLHEVAPETLPVPAAAPVAQPAVKNIDQVAKYTQGKPLPGDPPPQVYLREEAIASGHRRGSPDARVTMIEYAGLGNAYARVMHPALKKFLDANADRVNWEFRHYPGNGNDIEYAAAQASECVARQLGEDAFWQYLDAVFAEKSLTEAKALSLGAPLGADEAKLRQCVEGKELYDIVIADKFHAQADAKIFIVPTLLFLDHETGTLRVAEGANTPAYLQGILDELTSL